MGGVVWRVVVGGVVGSIVGGGWWREGGGTRGGGVAGCGGEKLQGGRGTGVKLGWGGGCKGALQSGFLLLECCSLSLFSSLA